jgi:hypothetical protein
VTDGVYTAEIVLFDQYMADQFTSASDGHGGSASVMCPSVDTVAVVMNWLVGSPCSHDRDVVSRDKLRAVPRS